MVACSAAAWLWPGSTSIKRNSRVSEHKIPASESASPAECSRMVLGPDQISSVLADLADSLHDLIHIAARTDRHILREPDRLFTNFGVGRCLIRLVPLGQPLLGVDSLEPARGKRIFQKRFLVQLCIAAGSRDALCSQRLQEGRAREAAKLSRIVTHHVKVVGISRAAFVHRGGLN